MTVVKKKGGVVVYGLGAVAILLGIIALNLLGVALVAWLLMLGLGALHTYFPAVPALGFWATFWVVFVLGVIASIFRRV